MTMILYTSPTGLSKAGLYSDSLVVLEDYPFMRTIFGIKIHRSKDNRFAFGFSGVHTESTFVDLAEEMIRQYVIPNLSAAGFSGGIVVNVTDEQIKAGIETGSFIVMTRHAAHCVKVKEGTPELIIKPRSTMVAIGSVGPRAMGFFTVVPDVKIMFDTLKYDDPLIGGELQVIEQESLDE